jgi:mannose-1-phosphate guanylyltransferase
MQPLPTHPSYAVILAGGSGQRFWPLSRESLPKQLLPLSILDGRSLLQATLDRLDGLLPLSHVLVLTGADQVAATRAQLPQLPEENVLAEPARRDTAPAIALGIAWVARRDPLATMMVLPADHLITDTPAFHHTLRQALHLARSGGLVTIGIPPTWPCPSFGYIERAAPLAGDTSTHGRAFHVASFREKPDAAAAQAFLDQGGFYWNAGMFAWTLPEVTAQLEQLQPQLASFIDAATAAPDLATPLLQEFPLLPKISIDYALMEKAAKVLTVEASFGWDDLGSFLSIASYLEQDGSSFANSNFSSLDSHRNIIYLHHPDPSTPPPHIALLGVEDLIFVHTPDAILIASRTRAEEIKKLVEILPEALR